MGPRADMKDLLPKNPLGRHERGRQSNVGKLLLTFAQNKERPAPREAGRNLISISVLMSVMTRRLNLLNS